MRDGASGGPRCGAAPAPFCVKADSATRFSGTNPVSHLLSWSLSLQPLFLTSIALQPDHHPSPAVSAPELPARRSKVRPSLGLASSPHSRWCEHGSRPACHSRPDAHCQLNREQKLISELPSPLLSPLCYTDSWGGG